MSDTPDEKAWAKSKFNSSRRNNSIVFREVYPRKFLMMLKRANCEIIQRYLGIFDYI